MRKLYATVLVAASLALAAPAQAEVITTYREATVGTHGANYNRAWGSCDYWRHNRAVRVVCDRNEQIAFRYHIGRPAMDSDEYIYSQDAGANIERFGGTGDTAVTRTHARVRVYIEGTFNGLIHRAWRHFVIAEDTVVPDPV